MAKRDESFFDIIYEILKRAPWWFGPILAAVVFVLLRYVVPHLIPKPSSPVDTLLFARILCQVGSWAFPAVILALWLIAEGVKLANRILFNSQKNIETIRQLSWQQFETLIAEAYRRKGYRIESTGSASGDGGIDVILRGNGETVLVQCKHWKVFSIGVKPVRELLGAVTDFPADKGIIITSGRFTKEAATFAARNRIELVDGAALANMIDEIKGLQSTTQSTVTPPASPPVSSNPCPSCNSPMVIRTARKGANAGQNFWGCTRYPNCRGTRPMQS